MTTPTRDQITEWLRLAEAATPGPWPPPIPPEDTGERNDWIAHLAYVLEELQFADHDFIIASRTAVPDLCRALLDMQDRLELAMAEAMAARELVNREGVSRIGNSSVDARRYAEARAANEKAEGE